MLTSLLRGCKPAALCPLPASSLVIDLVRMRKTAVEDGQVKVRRTAHNQRKRQPKSKTERGPSNVSISTHQAYWKSGAGVSRH